MPRLPLTIACAVLLQLSGTAWAQQPPGPPDPAQSSRHPHDLVREHATALGIDADTVERIEEIANSSKAERDSLHEAVQAERDALAELLRAESPDRATVLAKVDVLGAAETALLRQSLETLLDMHALLTPEQIKALEAMAPSGPPGGPPGGPTGGPPGGPPAGAPLHGPPQAGMPGSPMPRW